jgi:hypothetical protein
MSSIKIHEKKQGKSVFILINAYLIYCRLRFTYLIIILFEYYVLKIYNSIWKRIYVNR